MPAETARRARPKPKPLPPLFISKDGMSTMWFIIGMVAMVVSAVYVERVASTAGLRPQFIIMNNPDVLPILHRIDPDREDEILKLETHLAMESLFNKTPEGPDSKDRWERLFTQNTRPYVKKHVLDTQTDAFREGHMHQKVEIATIKLEKTNEEDGESVTIVDGQLLRTGVQGPRMFNELWTVHVKFVWIRNTCLKDCGRFPVVCDEFGHRETPISSTLRYIPPADLEPPKHPPATAAAAVEPSATPGGN